MTATGVVAIVGAVSTPVVALAAFVYNHVRGKEDRADARALATDAQQHDLEVRRRERAYEARKEAYTNVLQWALVMVLPRSPVRR